MSGVNVAEADVTLDLDGKRTVEAGEVQARVLAAQQVAADERWKLRDIETRHRLLFGASHEARLAVDGGTLRVIEANPAAARALGVRAGSSFIEQLAPSEREPFAGLLERVREFGGAPGIVLHFGRDHVPWAIRALLIDAEDGPDYLLHVTAVGVRAAVPSARGVPLDALMERLPDGFVIASGDGSILQANRAFLDLVQVGAAGAVQGHALGQWMMQPGADAAVLLTAVRRHGSVRSFATVLQGELGAEVRVEVSAAGYAADGVESFGVALRDVGRREGVIDAVDVPCPVDAVAEQVGRAPLSHVVRSAVDAIERSMIHAALERVDGNRTAAAELLGLSRQSLHSKLNRQAAEDGGAGQPEAGG